MRREYIVGIIIIILVGSGLAFLFARQSGGDGGGGGTYRDDSGEVSALDATGQEIRRTDGSPASASGQTDKPPYRVRKYQEIVSPGGFVNTEAITIGDLIGKKVILVDFLTYSCINCQRTFPYLNAWYEKYKDQGLEIIGIHTPEFAFERDIDNVREAMMEFGIKHPIVLDNEYATWNAFGNRYWPRKYLIDIRGNIVYDHIGEGKYEETEMKIRELLEELAGKEELAGALASESIEKTGNEATSPETYFGSLRNELLANGIPGIALETAFVLPERLAPNALYLAGRWNITDEYAEGGTGSRVVYRYNAKEVYLVASADSPAELEIFQDGHRVIAESGSDVVDGAATIEASRLYKIIRNAAGGEHTLELRVRSGKIRLFAFTFG
jgi:thiol-disulfide isomerase/thioredoxin